MSNFAIESFTTKTNKVDLVDAAHINTVQTSIVAIETALNILISQNGSLAQGTSYPGSPVTGQIFYRTDLGQVYIYTGSGWAAIGATTQIEIFLSSGTFVAPSGVTKVYLSMVGGGASGAVSSGGATNSGGGGGASVINYPYTVVPGNSYTVTVGAGGAGNSAAGVTDGSDGGDTSFDALTVEGGDRGLGNASGGGKGGNSTKYGLGIPGGDGNQSTNGVQGGGSAFGAGTAGKTDGTGSASAAANSGAGSGSCHWNSGGAITAGNGGSGLVIVAY